MQFLTKKSDAEPVVAPLWHANFRNFDRLPDTKVVRTTFFINTAAIAVTLGMILWLGLREYNNYNLGEQKADAQRQIDSNQKQNSEALRLSKAFLEEEKKVNEVAAFLKTPITPSEFIDLVSQSLPKDIVIEYAETRITDPKNSIFQLRGRIAGGAAQAAGIADRYIDMLRHHEKLGKIFDPITLNRLDKDPQGEFMAFDISLTVKK
ncbi:MAG TPA: hypothetical protein VG734_08135 [Lacunisphaera sp.]|nr:hypothetical protein [Lacunisphaera sp.]